MASNHDDKEYFASSITRQLSKTPYACSSLEHLLGGTANFLYRGILAQALPEGTRSVVVKHSEAFVPANRHFDFNITRCVGLLLACISTQHLTERVPSLDAN